MIKRENYGTFIWFNIWLEVKGLIKSLTLFFASEQLSFWEKMAPMWDGAALYGCDGGVTLGNFYLVWRKDPGVTRS